MTWPLLVNPFWLNILSSLCFFGGRNWSTKASHHFHHTTYINQISTIVEGIFTPALKLPALFLTWQFFNQFLPILPKFWTNIHSWEPHHQLQLYWYPFANHSNFVNILPQLIVKYNIIPEQLHISKHFMQIFSQFTNKSEIPVFLIMWACTFSKQSAHKKPLLLWSVKTPQTWQP